LACADTGVNVSEKTRTCSRENMYVFLGKYVRVFFKAILG